jgi:hypothetical protein
MRSNRALTQFAVKKLNEFLESGAHSFVDETQGNTSVTIQTDGDMKHLVFWLFGQAILELSFDEALFLDAVVYDGKFYDSKGRPSRTTRERLNGLLDALGQECLIPEGVRVFFAEEDGGCFVGLGKNCQPIGDGFSPVIIEANSTKLIFAQE